jgi:intein/homing endonuclease
MSISDKIAGYVRNIFKRENEVSRSDLPQAGEKDFNLFMQFGFDSVADYLQLDHDLMSRYVDYENMDDYPDLSCITGCCKIFTIEDGWIEVKKLAERGGEFHVLSYNRLRRSLLPAKAKNARITGKAGHPKQMVKVLFDNGESITCTDDHLFLTKINVWKKAGELKPGTRLMPGALRTRKLTPKSKNEYWQVHQPSPESIRESDGKRWTWIHKLVANELLERKKGEVVHHKDNNPLNNSLDNLSLETHNSHARKHNFESHDTTKYFPEWTDELRKERSRKMLGTKHPNQRKTDKKQRVPLTDKKLSEEHKRKIAEGHKIKLSREEVEAAYMSSSSITEAAKKLGVSFGVLKRRLEEFDLISDVGNHRVVNVIRISESYDVYDIEVPKYHNFVCNGVVVHNSALDIYADDSTQTDGEKNRSMWVECEDDNVQTDLTDMYDNKIRAEDNIWEISRTVCKYGSDYEEILVNDDGVQGLNFLPSATIRRFETGTGAILGFAQSYSGDFKIDKSVFGIEMPNGAMASQDGNTILYEPWKIAHFRLRSKMRKSKYGYCLSGESRVWTPDGVKFIKDIKPGDSVFTRHAGLLRQTKVLNHVCSGEKQTFKLKTAHREIILTGEHPVLVDKKPGRNTWVQVKDLSPNDKIMCVSNCPETKNNIPLGLLLDEFNSKSEFVLSKRGINSLKTCAKISKYSSKFDGLKRFAEDIGITKGKLDELLDGKSSLSFDSAKKLFSSIRVPFTYDSIEQKKYDSLILPDFIDHRFAKFWGYMLGNGAIENGCIIIHLGVYEERNIFYENYLRSIGLNVREVSRGDDGISRTINVSSKRLSDLMIKIGWINRARNKRVPYWVYNAPKSIRTAMIDGFMEADGWITKKGEYNHTELCNKNLLADIKTVIDGLGWISGNIRPRKPRDKKSIINGKEINSGDSYLLSFFRENISDNDFFSEKIVSKEPSIIEKVYDIEVADDGHCFVSDGIVVHNSVLEPARWIWKRLVLLEDAMLVYRLTRAPTRFAFYVDTGDMDADEATAHVRQMRNEFKKRKFVNSDGTLNMKYNPLCLTGDTKIALLDGRDIPIVNLVGEFNRGKENWVYSVDRSDSGKIVPGKIVWAGKTRKMAQLVEVTLDNGETIRTTPDHKFIKRDGKYCEARYLKSGDSLMPYKTLISSKDKGYSIDGYEMVYDPKTKKYIYTHRMVRDELKQNGVTHHENFIKTDNSPDNLSFMKKSEHSIIHRDNGHNIGHIMSQIRLSDPVLDKKLKKVSSANISAWNKIEKYIIAYNNSCKHEQDNVKRSENKKKFWENEENRVAFSEKRKIKFSDDFFVGVQSYVANNLNVSAEDVVNYVNNSRLIDLFKQENLSKKVHRHLMLKMYREKGFDNFKSFKKWASSNNHKVVSVKYIEQCEDTYTLTVEKYHNFALTAGIFIKNSQDEDFWIPTRSGKDSTRIDMLQGSMYQGIDDVDYFRMKLYAAIKVPRAYLGYEETISRATLCLAGNTMIPLLDGTSETIENLSKRSKPFWVYSCNDDGHIVPGLAKNARLTKKKTRTVEVVLDNGEILTCTPDHPIMMRDGSYREAIDLKPEDSLMPLYRRNASGIGRAQKLKDYEQVYSPGADANIEHLIEVAKSYRCKSKKELIKWSGYSECLLNRIFSENGIKYADFAHEYMLKYMSRSTATAIKKGRNHKVVEVREGPVIDTYDMTVDGYHNFATECGVFVHNSQEDVRFARTILRVQRVLKTGFHQIGRVHLAAKGLDPSSVNFNVMMTVPSAVFEMAQMEVRNQRAQLADSMQQWVSQRWIMENIFGMTNSEIEDILDHRVEDAIRMASIEGRQDKIRSKISMSGQLPAEKPAENVPQEDLQVVKKQLRRRFERRLTSGRDKNVSKDQVLNIINSNKELNKGVRELRILMREIKEAISYKKVA